VNSKNRLQNLFRGWFPQEPRFSSSPTIQTPKNKAFRNKLPRGEILFAALFLFSSMGYLLSGNLFAAPFLWFAAIVGVAAVLDTLVAFGRELNPKLAAGLLVAVVSGGGVLVNILVFSVPSGLLVRGFSTVMLAVVNVPLLIGAVAYFCGKKELSKKAIKWFSYRR
jgi:hypothetical protein